MTKCLVNESSLRFSRLVYGSLALTAFLIHNYWLVLIAGIFMILGGFSVKLNFPYRLYFIINKSIKKDLKLKEKESGELSFACGMGGVVLLFSFFLLYFEIFMNFAWVLILVMAILMFLASFVGICTASLIYVFFKKLLKK